MKEKLYIKYVMIMLVSVVAVTCTEQLSFVQIFIFQISNFSSTVIYNTFN